MTILLELLVFFLKISIIVIAALLLVAGIAAILSKGKENTKGKIRIKNLNKKYEALKSELQEKLLSKNDYKKLSKQEKKSQKKADKARNKKRIFVLDFDGDIKAHAVNGLREQVTAILTVAKPSDEVLLRLDSGGGVVHGYGLAASQLARIKDKNIPLTVAVDKVAASGGYMMACVADKIIAAPFAIIGSIGAVLQLPNIHRFLKKHNIEFEQLTAGQFKRTLSVFGENTSKGRAKAQEELEEIHELFKTFITSNRAQIDIEKVATGEHWPASRAKELNLVDALQTSDDYLFCAHPDAEIYELQYQEKHSLMDKLFGKVQSLVHRNIYF
ncbi:MAG: protease SohB [Gammaproteobacteria bacterium]